jgi:hypothetical protein
MSTSQSQLFKSKTNWCYGCVDRVGVRKFRELTAEGICQECDSSLRKNNPTAHSILVQSTHESAAKTAQSNRIKKHIQVAQKRIQDIEIHADRQRLFEEQERELIVVFNQIQEENKGIWWRKDAANRLGWSDSLLKEVIKRVRRYKELKPTPMTEVVLKFVTSDYQSARQILAKLPTAKVDWVHISLERLAKSGRITRLYNKPYESKYRLLETKSDYTIG